MEYIANWQEKNLRCYYCGETRSVKYKEEIIDPVISSEPTTVCVCNKCALLRPQAKVTAQKENK